VVAEAIAAEKPCLVLVRERKHECALLRMLRGAVSAETVDGRASPAQRKAAATRLMRGDTDVLVASGIFDTGVDLPEVRTVIVASAGKSQLAAVQRMGRGTRIAKDKDSFVLVDFEDRGNRRLEAHARMRIAAYRKEISP
jgi:superfamily II DNA or RNA helicase